LAEIWAQAAFRTWPSLGQNHIVWPDPQFACKYKIRNFG
jgi:hypothetical protein